MNSDAPPEKRPPGRPPTGRARKVQLPASMVQPSTLEWINAECARRNIARGVLIDELVEQQEGAAE